MWRTDGKPGSEEYSTRRISDRLREFDDEERRAPPDSGPIKRFPAPHPARGDAGSAFTDDNATSSVQQASRRTDLVLVIVTSIPRVQHGVVQLPPANGGWPGTSEVLDLIFERALLARRMEHVRPTPSRAWAHPAVGAGAGRADARRCALRG